jgi:hypothetical protein
MHNNFYRYPYTWISFKIDANSEVLLPEMVNLVGRRNWFAGLITGIQELYIRRGADVRFYSTGHTAFENRVVRYTTKIRRRSTTPASMSSSITY